MTLLSPPTPHPGSNRRIDFDFEATRVLAYRILHKPSTKDLHNRCLIVLTTESVLPKQIQILRAAGAIVRPVSAIGPPAEIDPKETIKHSKNQFTRLQIWNMTEYSKILYIEPDILPIRPLSALFETPPTKDMYGTEYLFAATYDSEQIRDSGKFTRPIPKSGPTDISAGVNFNTGMFLIHPSEQHARYLRAIYHDPAKAKHFSDMTEQSLLRYAYRDDGPYPWTRFSHMYNTQWPRLEDLAKSHAIRDKFWKEDGHVGWDLRRFWYFAWGEMRGHAVNDIIYEKALVDGGE